jgi:hypothetical protein
MKFGFDDATWEAGKAEARAMLIDYARRRQMIVYTDFVNQLHAIRFNGPHDFRLNHFLGEISDAEAGADRGMLTALVVHKRGDLEPGPGFFEMARDLGLDTSDILRCWVNEVEKVFAAWAA